ncbi:hypothetical protein DPMN_175688 [Dreissena polymorpha]|uniref:Uncharacterized protein n=1 Tax=Dreissena polymorpha TaxID=45954 RepID=A0A9D4E5M1_DREPO|nr:hypothetical protein DPMN_175688 [Dreissena polymorpha]
MISKEASFNIVNFNSFTCHVIPTDLGCDSSTKPILRALFLFIFWKNRVRYGTLVNPSRGPLGIGASRFNTLTRPGALASVLKYGGMGRQKRFWPRRAAY